jgi:hypothetical protein
VVVGGGQVQYLLGVVQGRVQVLQQRRPSFAGGEGVVEPSQSDQAE